MGRMISQCIYTLTLKLAKTCLPSVGQQRFPGIPLPILGITCLEEANKSFVKKSLGFPNRILLVVAGTALVYTCKYEETRFNSLSRVI